VWTYDAAMPIARLPAALIFVSSIFACIGDENRNSEVGDDGEIQDAVADTRTRRRP